MKKTTLVAALLITLLGFAFTMADAADKFVGKPGPEFHVEEWVSSQADTDGKYILIDFWATWCGPCVRGIPHMNELHSQFKDKVAIVAVSRESRDKVEAMKNPVMDYYSAIDSQGRMGRFFEIRSIPHVVLMDPDGIVLWKGHPGGLSKSKLKSLISDS
ncbi:TlpA family protein disulfide reductase [Pelagicoccus mobilis]|uniref:Redoxin domain-containing protein n=1 Tax=Pelagicoccus mobilis TaxID=415221 RepID=A0A934S3A8_9BACT|nr:thioredoxin-like domain-containing protein [Pelagicoccus mobilis]MBK1880410.1 redoxin domain-containing protein [Pelagicoccus mobilis]